MNKALTFLIVDDDSDDCDFFREAVMEINPQSQCFTARNGEDALYKLRNEMTDLPDFIFLDLNMQRMDGRKCLIELKLDNMFKEIPVVILTTSTSQKDIDDTKRLGAFYFLTKPSEYQKLQKEIVQIIGQRQSSNSNDPGVFSLIS